MTWPTGSGGGGLELPIAAGPSAGLRHRGGAFGGEAQQPALQAHDLIVQRDRVMAENCSRSRCLAASDTSSQANTRSKGVCGRS